MQQWRLSRKPPEFNVIVRSNCPSVRFSRGKMAKCQGNMAKMKIRPAHSIQGSLLLPGDKSISHRAAMLATLGTTRTTISNFATSEDCRSTVDCMRALGVKIEQQG